MAEYQDESLSEESLEWTRRLEVAQLDQSWKQVVAEVPKMVDQLVGAKTQEAAGAQMKMVVAEELKMMGAAEELTMVAAVGLRKRVVAAMMVGCYLAVQNSYHMVQSHHRSLMEVVLVQKSLEVGQGESSRQETQASKMMVVLVEEHLSLEDWEGWSSVARQVWRSLAHRQVWKSLGHQQAWTRTVVKQDERSLEEPVVAGLKVVELDCSRSRCSECLDRTSRETPVEA